MPASHFRDEAQFALLRADGDCQQSNPRSSTSSTVFDADQPYFVDDTASSTPMIKYQDRYSSSSDSSQSSRRGSAGSEVSLVGSFISDLKQKLPSLQASTTNSRGYRLISAPHVARRRRAVLTSLVIATLLLVSYAVNRTFRAPAKDAHDVNIDAGLYDDDSQQDASISVPTFPRPSNPKSVDQVLPLHLHHDEKIDLTVQRPSSSQSNRRMMYDIPSQKPLLESPECLEQWITNGAICDQLIHTYSQSQHLTEIDIIYSWVNGSDWRHSSAKWMHAYRPQGRWQEYVEQDLFPTSATKRDHESKSSSVSSTQHVSRSSAATANLQKRETAIQSRFRDHQELRYAMRSAAQYLRGLSTIHVVAPDYSAPYHIQPRPESASSSSSVRRRVIPFKVDLTSLLASFRGLPSQLRRVQGLRTDRFVTHDGQIREGQVPQWMANTTSIVNSTSGLATNQTSDSSSNPNSTAASPRVRLHHDWNSFKSNWLITSPSTPLETQKLMDYRRLALPNFNSMAIESMLGDEPDLAENFIYANDDFFFLDDASVSDFVSPLYGPVFRMDPNLVVKGKKSPTATDGEWGSLFYTNWLLDERFGKRIRPYVNHVHKSFSKSLLWETRMTWAQEHATLGLNRFRNTGDNIVSHFLTYYNIMERHREALLWTFFVLRLDQDGDGQVSASEWDSALAQMGLSQQQVNETQHRSEQSSSSSNDLSFSVEVRLPKRSTLGKARVNSELIKAGWPVPLNTKYVFSSQDGFPLARLSYHVIMFRREESEVDEPDASRMQKKSRRSVMAGALAQPRPDSYGGWPDFVDEPRAKNDWKYYRFERTACTLHLDRCFLRPFPRDAKISWDQVFKNFAFERVECGDCLIHHLVGQSGARGFDAFLPPSDRVYHSDPATKPSPNADGLYLGKVPHLPLATSWRTSQDANGSGFEAKPAELEPSCFSVQCVLANSGFAPGSSLRNFAARLIQRYSYVIGNSPIEFKQLETPSNADRIFDYLDKGLKEPTASQILEKESLRGKKVANDASSNSAPPSRGSEALGSTQLDADSELHSQELIDVKRPFLVCINDDITQTWVNVVGKQLSEWLAKAWPQKQRWEL